MEILIILLVTVFILHDALSVQYEFTEPWYSLVETPDKDNKESGTVLIRRTGTAQELNTAQSISLNTTCPPGVTATASELDYSVAPDITFSAGETEKPVSITIKTEEEDEVREIFCITIETDPGSQSTTQIVIPGNDYCREVLVSGGNMHAIRRGAVYVGPWIPSISDTIEFDITPKGSGADMLLFIASRAFPISTFDYYGVYIEDSNPAEHTIIPSNVGDTLIVESRWNQIEAILTTDNIITTGVTTKLWLRYEQSSTTGIISIGSVNDRNTPLYQYTDTTDPFTVNHIFVGNRDDDLAVFKVCIPANPRQLALVGASSDNYLNGGSPMRAIDGNRDSDFTNGRCFLSDDIDDPWLQIDLGEVYDIRFVIIWPVDDDSSLNVDSETLDNADVLVGSCDPSRLSTANVCGNVGSLASDNEIPILVSCPEGSNTLGRYVYIRKVTPGSSAQTISLCDVDVYGIEAPFGDEIKVEFSQPLIETHEDGVSVSVSVKRTGTALTCTSVEFYTDTSTLPVAGNPNDFTAIPNDPGNPLTTLTWDGNDVSGATKSFSIFISNDDMCEPYETFKVYLTNVEGGIIGSQSTLVVGIKDDDSVTYQLESPAGVMVNEGNGSVYIGISRSGVGVMQPGSAELILTEGSATVDEDYSNIPLNVDFGVSSASDNKYGVVPIEQDQHYEIAETFSVGLGQLAPVTCSMAATSPTYVTVTIKDDDSQFWFQTDTDSDTITIKEGDKPKMVEIRRTGEDQLKIVDILVETGSADDDDYSISQRFATFRAGESSAFITLEIEDDTEVESDESFSLTLQDRLYPAGNLVKPYTITVMIVDNDAEYNWKQSFYSVEESESLLYVCVTRTGYRDTRKVIAISASRATADIDRDFRPVSSIEFDIGIPEQCVAITIVPDDDVEPTETFTLTLMSGQDVVLGGMATTTVSITDDDSVIGFLQPEYTFSRSDRFPTVAISKLGTVPVSVTVFVVSGSAILDTDFSTGIVGSSSIITIPADQSSYSIPVAILNTDEPMTKSFTMTLSFPNVGSIAPSQAITTVIITSDDQQNDQMGGQQQGSDSALSGGAIAGIMVGAFVGVIAIISIVGIVLYVGGIGGVGGGAAKSAATYPLATFSPGYGNGLGGGLSNPYLSSGQLQNGPYTYPSGPYGVYR